jgi:hypothetical protein
MDYLEKLKGVTRYYCIGLCSGANVAAAALRVDSRVRKAVLINPLFTLAAQGAAGEQLIIYRKHAFLNTASWARLLTFRSDYQRIWRTLWTGCRRIGSRITARRKDRDVENQIREYFHIIGSKNRRVLMIFSHTEYGDVYLKRVLGKEYRLLKEAGILTIVRIKNADHSMTMLANQN